MAKATIRPARAEDANDIHALMLAAFTPFRDQYTDGCFDATVLDPERIRARLQQGPGFVAEYNGHVVGAVSCVTDKRGLYVRGMAVHPDARRQGIGRLLLDACKAVAHEASLTCMWLSTTLFLEGSIALYQAYGFVDAHGPADLHGTPLRSFELRLPRQP